MRKYRPDLNFWQLLKLADKGDKRAQREIKRIEKSKGKEAV